MGYTHYWDFKKEVKGFNPEPLKKDIDTIFNEHKDIITYEYDINKPPLCKVEGENIIIRFNGIGDDGHETFYFSSKEVTDFTFCKTARKLYDVVVCKVLTTLKEHYGDSFNVKSDGFSNVQPFGFRYSVGDKVSPNHLDGTWGEVQEYFIGKGVELFFTVNDVYGDGGRYFSYFPTIKETEIV